MKKNSRIYLEKKQKIIKSPGIQNFKKSQNQTLKARYRDFILAHKN